MQHKNTCFRAKCIIALLLMAAWTATGHAENALEMVGVCEAEADELAGSAGAQVVQAIRQRCKRLRPCAKRCIAYDGQAASSCVAQCLLPNSAGAGPLANDTTPSDQILAPKISKKDTRSLCSQARDFRDHQLFRQWDIEQNKYVILTDGGKKLVALRNQTSDLLDDEWWAGSTGSSVAIEIKGFADMVNDTMALFVPESALVAGTIHRAIEIAKGVTVVGDLVTYTKENAEAAAKQNVSEVFAQYGGPIGAGTKLLLDAAGYAKSKKDDEDYRETVQMQVRRINQDLKDLDAKRKRAVQQMDAYQEVVRSIDIICANDAPKSIPINGPN
jgi:hypothetical protein